MPSFSFSKIIPGGNPTIILPDPSLSPAELAEFSAHLMSSLHIGAEQVGALYYNGGPSDLPRLQMMGGEFCVNATRAAALLLARQGRLDVFQLSEPKGAADPFIWGGLIAVSGMQQPIAILAATESDALLRAATSPDKISQYPIRNNGTSLCETAKASLLHCAARVDCSVPGTSCLPLEPGATLVRMPGISHLLLEASLHPFPGENKWRATTKVWRKRCGLDTAPASGVIWFSHEKGSLRIWPAVEVKATASEHLETACGSASLALALWQWHSNEHNHLLIKQPSSEILQVFPAIEPGRAWISGPVQLAAEGIAYL